MSSETCADIVICGAGIAGVSAAYSLAVERKAGRILLIDRGDPLNLTSDHSTESYRNWWPGPGNAMVQLMNASIDRLELLAQRSGNVFRLNRRGYLYCSADSQRAVEMQRSAAEISALGAGELRIHTAGSAPPTYQPHHPEEFEGQPGGADLLLDPQFIRAHFPFLSEKVVAALHVRRAGWLSAQQLGMYLLEQARAAGVEFVSGEVSGVTLSGGRVHEVHLADGRSIAAGAFVNAAGPHLGQVGHMLGVDLPIYHELHQKLAMRDVQTVLPRHAPLVIWSDPQRLDWSADEREYLEEEAEYRLLLEELPPGLHTRPDGGSDSPIILVLWEYHTRRMTPAWPLPEDSMYPDVLLRGLPAMIPGMHTYRSWSGKPRVDGGYYTRTPENRPLIGKLPVDGAFVIGALSGFGVMAACAAGELLAAHICGEQLPAYAPAFSLERYTDSAYQAMLTQWGASGQL